MKRFADLGRISRRALVTLGLFTLVCGVVYTAAATGIGQLLFPNQANGSIIEVNGVRYGSELLAQYYDDDDHMWGRIMKLDYTTYTDSDGNIVVYATGANISPESEEYAMLVAERVERIQAAHPEMAGTPIPADLVTCSGSGLDPHISDEAAVYQMKRLASNNDLDETYVQNVIDCCTTGKILGIFGTEIVNVLKVNLILDGILGIE